MILGHDPVPKRRRAKIVPGVTRFQSSCGSPAHGIILDRAKKGLRAARRFALWLGCP
jgi:hypothetical protein